MYSKSATDHSKMRIGAYMHTGTLVFVYVQTDICTNNCGAGIYYATNV